MFMDIGRLGSKELQGFTGGNESFKKLDEVNLLPTDKIVKGEKTETTGIYEKPIFEKPKAADSPVTDILVIPKKASAAKSGNWSGINKPVIGTDEDGNKVVFKHNNLGIFARVCPPTEMRTRDVKEVVASHIMADEFNLPTVTYQEGHINDEKGIRRDGIVCKFVEGLHTLEDMPVSEIKTPDLAVTQSIVKGWMGDWDITKNDSNVWIKPDGSTLAADFGFSIFDGITDFKIPNANEKVMTAFSKPENVKPIVDKIKNLSDDDIKGMVHRCGSKNIRDWNEKWETDFSDTLIRNRDRLKKKNPFENYYKGFHPFLKSPLNKLTYPLIFFTPEFQVKGSWGHPEVVVDTLKALAGVYQMPVLAKTLLSIEEKIIARQERNKQQTQA
jgi:hypothetical protein